VFSAAIFVFTALGSFSYKWLQRGQGEEAFTELSGRLEWWHAAWIHFLEHPIAGMGAYAGGKFVVMKSLGVNASSTHSDYIELLVGSGIIGTALFAIAIIWTTALLFRYTRDKSLPVKERQLSLEAFGVLIVLVVHSFFNVELIWHAPLFFLIVLGWAELLRRKQQQRAELAFRRRTTTTRPTPMYAMN
jgi:O-antigen ligase